MDRYSPKHVEFYSKNKFEKLMFLVGFIIRILQWNKLVVFITVKSSHVIFMR